MSRENDVSISKGLHTRGIRDHEVLMEFANMGSFMYGPLYVFEKGLSRGGSL